MLHAIDPKIDCVFKALLGNEENRNLLIHFLKMNNQRYRSRIVLAKSPSHLHTTIHKAVGFFFAWRQLVIYSRTDIIRLWTTPLTHGSLG